MSKAFVFGYDESQKDLMEWSTALLRSFCDIPIETFRIEDFTDRNGWFAKPAILIKALEKYEQVVWVDNDVQTRADPSDIFYYIDHRLLLATDYHRDSSNSRMWNTGVVGCSRESLPFLNIWDKLCLQKVRHGDQECLSSYVNKFVRIPESLIKPMPPKYHGQRLMLGPSHKVEDFVFFHWHGQVGKEHIRENLL